MKFIGKEDVEGLGLMAGDKIKITSVCNFGEIHKNTGIYIESFEDDSGGITVHYRKISRPGRIIKTNITKLEKI